MRNRFLFSSAGKRHSSNCKLYDRKLLIPNFHTVRQYLVEKNKSISQQLHEAGGYSLYKAKLIKEGKFTEATIPYFADELIRGIAKNDMCIELCQDAMKVDFGVYNMIPLRYRDTVAVNPITASPVQFYNTCHTPTQGYMAAIKNKPSLILYNDLLQNSILYYETLSGRVSRDMIPDELLGYLPYRIAMLFNNNQTNSKMNYNLAFDNMIEQYPDDRNLAATPHDMALSALLENPNDFIARYDVYSELYLDAIKIKPEIILFNTMREDTLLKTLLKNKCVISDIKSIDGLEDKINIVFARDRFLLSDYTIKKSDLPFTTNQPHCYQNLVYLRNYKKAYKTLTEEMMIGMLLANPLKFFRTNDVTESVYVSAFKINPMIAFYNTGQEDEILINALLNGIIKDSDFECHDSLHGTHSDDPRDFFKRVSALRYVGKSQRSAYYDKIKFADSGMKYKV